jgi:hypothetical protein
MKLDPKTGALVVGEIEMSRETAEASFGNPTRRRVPDGDHTWIIIARFEAGRLVHVTLLADDPSFGTSWYDFTLEQENARRAVHDAFLTSALGPAHEADEAHYSKAWSLPWGRVRSSHDPRSGSTDIQILYT